MIEHCDICGKFFDSDYEVGTYKNGLTYCEDCSTEKLEKLRDEKNGNTTTASIKST